MPTDDTTVSVFTRVPKRVARTWYRGEVPIVCLTHNENGPIEESLIDSVTLIIEYRDMIATEEAILTEDTDERDTRAEVWKSAKTLYTDLTKSISDRLRELSRVTLESAKEHRARSVELVKNTRTETQNRSISQNSSPTIVQQGFRPQSELASLVTSVDPNDSASRVDTRSSRRSSRAYSGSQKFTTLNAFIRPPRRRSD